MLLIREHQRNMWSDKRWHASLQCMQRKICWKWIHELCFLMHSECIVIIFSGFEKITRVNFLVVYSNKIHIHDSLAHMHGLWKSVMCVILASLLVHCVSISWKKTDLWFCLLWNCSCCKALQVFSLLLFRGHFLCSLWLFCLWIWWFPALLCHVFL